MTVPKPYDLDDLKTMWRLLGDWLGDKSKESIGPGLTRHLNQQFVELGAARVSPSLVGQQTPFNLAERMNGWMICEPLPDYPIVPIMTISIQGMGKWGRVSELAFRVALLEELSDGSIHGSGWRFETGEQMTEREAVPAHPYAHAQAITGWERNQPCLIHPPHRHGETCSEALRPGAAPTILVKHPAFVLPAKTLTGLALDVIATLYGSQRAFALVKDDLGLRRLTASDFKSDISRYMFKEVLEEQQRHKRADPTL